LARILAGDVDLAATGGSVQWKGEELLVLSAPERVRRGIFVGFPKGPPLFPGMSVRGLLQAACEGFGRKTTDAAFRRKLKEGLHLLDWKDSTLGCELGEEFPLQARPLLEFLQAFVIEPDLAVLPGWGGVEEGTRERLASWVRSACAEGYGFLFLASDRSELLPLLPGRIHKII
jgi:Fe-S cluster assembly ATPase SufC